MGKSKTCFVIMGYGVRTDYRNGRILDLDKTYNNIIKPAVRDLGMICKRADEIRHSGNIDIPMYKYILSADVVIADLSTYNPNAFYELGVRHALRPYSTIAISENELVPPFDVSHTLIHQYEHLGKDIGYSEVVRFKEELKKIIEEILENPETDSPVYTFLKDLKFPQWENSEQTFNSIKADKTILSRIIEDANRALEKDNFLEAQALFKYALSIDKSSSYIIQRLALCTYKSKHPHHKDALLEALRILEPLNLDETNDTETLGLAGAINKRLWEETKDKIYLNRAILFYEKGFLIQKDYYNGINLSYMLNERGSESSGYEAIADYVIATRVRKQVVSICEQLLEKDVELRNDKYWILSTMEEALFGLGEIEKYNIMKKRAKDEAKENWERETTENQINKLKILLAKSPMDVKEYS
ncbi:TRAFs-binding domain-containing protein [Priestia megaterium]|uniref:TRAFs-binding domain-containing protein n=1 Tax=Priestia megaterium TaxID=1404 RepID=UPI000BFDBA1A|nr:TRAFs-binding domain-containing protein [Priestia megaterium]PGT76776.1 hypothetical protein COD15_02870 [Priestia megaterium]